MTIDQILIAVLCSLLGPGVVTVIVQWLLRHHETKQNNALENRIEHSPTIRRLELEIYRQSLFQTTTSRMQHEHQLDAGKAYVERGGNGAGHARYQQLNDDYRQRLKADDWNYQSRHSHN